MMLSRARPPSLSRLISTPVLALAASLAVFAFTSSGKAQTPAVAAPTLPAPLPRSTPAPASQMGSLTLSAQFSGDQGAIRRGLEWRIFKIMEDNTTSLVQRSKAEAPAFTLERGDYFVHVSYGFASASKRVTVGETPIAEKITLAAGALRLGATLGDQPVPRAKVTYTIYTPAPGDPEGHQLASGIRSGEAVRLAEGVYHVVSTYGDANATVRTDIKVESGRMTDATLRHRAATVTLKLVETPGGEALADTNWSVFSPGGDIVQESVGAFATMTLAEGLYSVVARHAGKTYARDFKVDTGHDGDVEVLATGGQ
ncbi:MAG: hypothetical protein JO216_12880 [Hyphomicrobiales bacterium]|nr:hypothetical protein [Hyphomicrobiales bacterium]